MARWRLTAPHYLNVEGTSWEYKEVNRTTGKQQRTVFPVPLHLDPDNPADWNIVRGKDDGEIVVTTAASPQFPNDIVFVGDPTPDMVPLDDEAKAISASMAPRWKHPIESLTTTYADAMLRDLTAEMDEVRSKTQATPVEGVTEILTAMTAMMKQNQEMLAMLAGKATAEPEPKAARRA